VTFSKNRYFRVFLLFSDIGCLKLTGARQLLYIANGTMKNDFPILEMGSDKLTIDQLFPIS